MNLDRGFENTMLVSGISLNPLHDDTVLLDEIPVVEFEQNVSHICFMLRTLLRAEKVAFWLFNETMQEVLCFQDKLEPERIGATIGIEQIPFLLERLKQQKTIVITHAEQDLRFCAIPMTENQSDLLLSYVYCDEHRQGIFVARRHPQIAWPENYVQLIENGGEFVKQLLSQLHVPMALIKSHMWQSRLIQLDEKIKNETGSRYFSLLSCLLKNELNAKSVTVAEIIQKTVDKISLKLIASSHKDDLTKKKTHITLSRHKYFDSNSKWVLCKDSYPELTEVAKAENVLAFPIKNDSNVIGVILVGFDELRNKPEDYYQSISQLYSRISSKLDHYQYDSELRLSAVAFEANKGCIITDPALNILRVNQAFCQITGYPSEFVIGKKLGHGFWFLSDRQQKTIDRSQYWSCENERQRFSGEFYPQRESWTPVFDDTNQLSHYVINIEDLTERAKSNQRIRELAYFDELTGLANRRRLLEEVRQQFLAAKETDQVGSLLFIDLDHFKNINDSLGHAAGDWVLQQVAERLKPFFNHHDLLARLGGDEFVALLPGVTSNPPQAEMHAITLSERIIEVVAEPYEWAGQILHLGASVGITLYPTKEQQPEDLLKQADTAMYQAKADGRNTVSVFNAEMQRKVDKKLRISNQLRDALRNQELSLHYQPQHMVETGELIGAEALIRWQNPKGGLISPIEFIPIAEETDLIIDIGQWVMEEACQQYMTWYHHHGLVLPQISVNVSAKQFHSPDFVDLVYETLDKTNMMPEALNLEITESVVVEGLENTIQKMTELKSIGVNFSLDDFGTGYSSLGYLTRLPVNELKIDRTFIKGIPNDVSNMAIAEAVLAMAQHLGFNVTAEGVETRQQLEFLQRHACHFYQGYFASKPLSAEFMTNYLVQFLKNKN